MKLSATPQTKLIAREYLAEFVAQLEHVDLEALERVVERLRAARDAGSMVYIAGNGGSAATATHWANDLAKATKRSGRAPMRMMCLSDNTSWLTALGNDEGYERVFAGQLENFARPDDVLIVISASGNSPNLLRAVELARERDVVTIGLLGFDGGALKSMVTESLWLETEIGAYGLVETGHVLMADIITTCFIRDRPEASRDG
jgi:D-sedoheptulose 7-phosphate isomerase